MKCEYCGVGFDIGEKLCQQCGAARPLPNFAPSSDYDSQPLFSMAEIKYFLLTGSSPDPVHQADREIGAGIEVERSARILPGLQTHHPSGT